MRRKLVLTAAGFVMSSAALVACGEDTPAEFKSQLETVDGDLDQLTNDAKSEFSEQVESVATTWEALGTSVEAATADPSGDTLAAATTALSAFTTEVQALNSDVKSTC